MTVQSNVIIRSLYKYILFGRIGERLVFFLPHPLGPPLLQRRGGRKKKEGLSPLSAGHCPLGDKSPLIPLYERGKESLITKIYGLYNHPLPFVRGELERDFPGGGACGIVIL